MLKVVNCIFSAFVLMVIISSFSWAETQTDTIQSTKEPGKDAYICTCKPTTVSPAGDATHAWQGVFNGPQGVCEERFLIEWDLTSLPAQCEIVSATMQLYCDYFFGKKVGKTVYCRATEPWEEKTVTWKSQPGQTEEAKVLGDWPVSGWWSVDMTEFVKGWVRGEYPNHGVVAKSEDVGNELCSAAFFTNDTYYNERSKDNKRPRLIVTYQIPESKVKESGLYEQPAR